MRVQSGHSSSRSASADPFVIAIAAALLTPVVRYVLAPLNPGDLWGPDASAIGIFLTLATWPIAVAVLAVLGVAKLLPRQPAAGTLIGLGVIQVLTGGMCSSRQKKPQS